MDKNNDIQVNKVSKWEAAPVSIKNLRNYILECWKNYAAPPCCPPLDSSCQDSICESMITLLESVLDDYNELEAKYQESCGMISQYEEENRIMQGQVKKLIDARVELTDDNNKLERDCDIYAEHLSGLCRTLSDNDIIADWSEEALKWSLYIWDEVKGQWRSYDKATACESCKKHYEEELRIREKEKDEKDKLIDELNSKFKVLKLSMNMMYGCYGYGLNTPDELNRKIEELKKENEELKSKNRSLQLRTNMMYGCHRSTDNANRTLAKVVAGFENKNKELEKENKGLKDTLNKDREFGKNVGELIVESIREGCDKGAYELHPYTRIDVHVEETNNMPTTFDRHAIPRIAVMFNNTQTEMERDTAEHECEELEKKFKELVKENEDLRSTLKMCERDANMSRSLCHNIAFNAERARNKTPWFNDMQGDDI